MKTNPLVPDLSFLPLFYIDETQSRRFRIAFSAPSSSNLRVRGKYADVSLPENGVIEASVHAAEMEQDGSVRDFKVWINATGISGQIEVGVLTFIGSEVLTGAAIADVEAILDDKVQQAFFAALTGRAAPAAEERTTTRAAAVPAAQPVSGWRRWLPRRMNWKLVAVGMISFVAVGLISYGAINSFLTPKDSIQQALDSEDYKGLQDRIRQQIATNNSGNGEFGALQGQNIAIETMKSMGLEPGKANSGCLVGVK